MPDTGRPRSAHTSFLWVAPSALCSRLLRRGKRELTRSEWVAPVNLLVLARPGRNAFHRSRTRPPPAKTSACCGKTLKAAHVFVIRCMTHKGQTVATPYEGSMKELAVCTTLAVPAHAAVVVWHLFVLAKIPPGLTGPQILSAVLAINLVPFMGLVLLWTHYPRLASVLIFIPLAVGFSAGGFEHFLSNGPDTFRMAATEWSVPFTISAVLLALLELGACWLCIRLFGKAPLRSASELARNGFTKGLFIQPIQDSRQ
jgi:hypothetical protein